MRHCHLVRNMLTCALSPIFSSTARVVVLVPASTSTSAYVNVRDRLYKFGIVQRSCDPKVHVRATNRTRVLVLLRTSEPFRGKVVAYELVITNTRRCPPRKRPWGSVTSQGNLRTRIAFNTSRPVALALPTPTGVRCRCSPPEPGSGILSLAATAPVLTSPPARRQRGRCGVSGYPGQSSAS